MITFILLAAFGMIGILLVIVASTANNRKRAGMNGIDPAAAHRNVHR